MELIKPPGLTKPGNGKAQRPVIQIELKDGIKPTPMLLQSVAALVDVICEGHNILVIAKHLDFAAINKSVQKMIVDQEKAQPETETE